MSPFPPPRPRPTSLPARLLGLSLLVLAACGSDDSSGTGSASANCGDAACGAEESCSSCPADCGSCEPAGGGGNGATGGTATGGAGASSGGFGGTGADGPNSLEPSRYALELVSPRAAGSSPSTDPGTPSMPSGHRIFKAYPGLEYNIRAVVIGGSFPFTYALGDAPAGMTINPWSGEISWPNPEGSSATPTITVTDAEGTVVSSPWTITVTTSGFRFVDAQSGSDSSPGTLESPWQTISKIKESGAPGEIVFFRSGTYTTAGMETDGGDTWVRVEFNGGAQPVQWLAYPGETPTIDNDYVGPTNPGRFIRLSGSDTHPVYLDGFEIVGSWDKGLQFGSGSCDYPVFRRLSIHDIAEAIDGSNSAGIMTLRGFGDPSWYAAYQDNDFHDNAAGGIKQYSHNKLLWEDCQFRDSGAGPDLKSYVPRFEVRRCTFRGNTGEQAGLFGNMNNDDDPVAGAASGEVRYNLMLGVDDLYRYVMDVNQDGMAAKIDLYRNTFVGTVRVNNADSADGVFHFEHNVIVNSNEGTDHITLSDVSDPSVVTYLDNLSGAPADSIVDASGELTGSYTSYVGTRGHFIP